MGTKPMLFNIDMVRAILAGKKTVTRRVVREPYYIDKPDVCIVSEMAMHRGVNATHGMPYPDRPYEPGDILYVREAWSTTDNLWNGMDMIIYRATYNGSQNSNIKWRPSIHMPREAARIFLRVKDVRVERLMHSFFDQGSAIFELRAEGIDIGSQCRQCIAAYGSPCCIDDESECGALDDIRDDFASIWDSTIKPADRAVYGWTANPWMWVIEFERCERPDEFGH